MSERPDVIKGLVPASVAEREIRAAAVDALREHFCGRARIIHELTVGGCRADLAAVTTNTIILVELRSERDTLDRLPMQAKHFSRAAHHTILVAHRKWFDTAPYADGSPRLASPDGEAWERFDVVWAYPQPTPGEFGNDIHRWRMPTERYPEMQPHAYHLLSLLWREELLAECRRHRITTGARDNVEAIKTKMAWAMTGREIAEAVCRQIRARPFPDADAPIYDAPEACMVAVADTRADTPALRDAATPESTP